MGSPRGQGPGVAAIPRGADETLAGGKGDVVVFAINKPRGEPEVDQEHGVALEAVPHCKVGCRPDSRA